MRLEEKTAKTLMSMGQTLSVAESCTGGLISHKLTNIPGSSSFFLLGIIAYAYEAKTQILKVPPALLKKHGAVSAHVAQYMAKGVRNIFKSDYAISVTGIAGPGGATASKPVGLVYIGLSSRHATVSRKYHFTGTRLQVKNQTCTAALTFLLETLEKQKN